MAEKLSKKKMEENFTVIDGKDLILGRLGSNIAKRVLMGESIKIVNCKDIVILGKKKFLVERYKNKLANKVVKQGPYYSRSSADLVKRAFRNMLPYKNQRGIEAFKRIKCYNSTPSILASAEKSTVDVAKIDENTVFYYTRVEEISKALGYVKDN